MSLMGGRRVVRVRDAADGISASLKHVLEAGRSGDALLVLEAGDLGKSLLLAQAVRGRRQGRRHRRATPTSPREVAALIRDTLQAQRISIDDDTVEYLVGNLGSDRAVSRQEIEKLVLYAGAGGRIELADAIASVGDSSALELEDVIYDFARRPHRHDRRRPLSPVPRRPGAGLDRARRDAPRPAAAFLRRPGRRRTTARPGGTGTAAADLLQSIPIGSGARPSNGPRSGASGC